MRHMKILLILLILLTLTSSVSASFANESKTIATDNNYSENNNVGNSLNSLCESGVHQEPFNFRCGISKCVLCNAYLEKPHDYVFKRTKFNSSSTDCYLDEYKCSYCGVPSLLNPGTIFPHSISDPQWVSANPVTATLCQELKRHCTYPGCSYSSVSTTMGHTYAPFSCNCHRCNYPKAHDWRYGERRIHATSGMCYSSLKVCNNCGYEEVINTYYTHYYDSNGYCYHCRRHQ